jgi:hypothetical protein
VNNHNSQRVIGHIRGSAKIRVDLDAAPITMGASETPADLYADYVRREVQLLMEANHGQCPTEVRVSVTFDGDE